MYMFRNLVPDWDQYDAMPHLVNQSKWQRGALARGGVHSLHMPEGEPMMETSPGRYIPAAQDPTDRRTWRTQVIFT